MVIPGRSGRTYPTLKHFSNVHGEKEKLATNSKLQVSINHERASNHTRPSSQRSSAMFVTKQSMDFYLSFYLTRHIPNVEYRSNCSVLQRLSFLLCHQWKVLNLVDVYIPEHSDRTSDRARRPFKLTILRVLKRILLTLTHIYHSRDNEREPFRLRRYFQALIFIYFLTTNLEVYTKNSICNRTSDCAIPNCTMHTSFSVIP